jgi:two-component system cell cycle sensor histidine kinase PleC
MLLLGVINDLLDLARLETVGIELDEGSIDVEKAVQEVLRGAVLQASQRQVGLTWVPSAAKLPDLFCDRSRLRQMLLNILLSAAQFDKPGRMVEVGTELSDGLAIVIRDNGWGVLIDALKLILTKSLIERHGGNLSMVSTLNDGVTLRLSFPPERIIRGGW